MPASYLDVCPCPADTRLQILGKINANLVNLFSSMATDFVGTRVTMIGDGCGCTELQVLAAINQNLAEFGEVFAGGGSSFVRLVTPPASSTSSGSPGDFAEDNDYLYVYTGNGVVHTWARSPISDWS